MSAPSPPLPPRHGPLAGVDAKTWRIAGGVGAVVLLLATVSMCRMNSDPRHIAGSEVDRLAKAMMALHQPLRTELTTLQLGVAMGRLASGDLRGELERRAREIDAVDLGRGADLPARQKIAAAQYFASLDSRIEAAQRWPADRPSVIYANMARAVVKRARAQFADALARNVSPSAALADTWSVVLWTQGKTDGSPEAVENPFHDDEPLIAQVVEALLPQRPGATTAASAKPGMGYGALQGAR